MIQYPDVLVAGFGSTKFPMRNVVGIARFFRAA